MVILEIEVAFNDDYLYPEVGFNCSMDYYDGNNHFEIDDEEIQNPQDFTPDQLAAINLYLEQNYRKILDDVYKEYKRIQKEL